MCKEIDDFTIETFIKKAINRFGDIYDYSKAEYINARTKMEIICPIHGSFFQTRLDHLRATKGCSKCGNKLQSIALLSNGEEFVKKAKEKHGDLYDYSAVDYVNSRLKVEIKCQHHGVFFQSPKAHLRAIVGCEKCAHISKYKKTENDTIEFIKKALVVHGNLYDYSKVVYKHSGLKLSILCKKHGTFLQRLDHHLKGSGCPKCTPLKRMGYSRSEYIKQANDRVCTFYTIRCFNEEEEFYKIGITMNNVKNRYSGNKTMPYEYEVISETKGSAGFIWDLERDEKKKLKLLHYTPKLRFGGSETECFTDYKLQ